MVNSGVCAIFTSMPIAWARREQRGLAGAAGHRGTEEPSSKMITSMSAKFHLFFFFSCVNIVDVHAIICSHFVNHWGVTPKN